MAFKLNDIMKRKIIEVPINSLEDYITKTCNLSTLSDEEPGLFNIYRGQKNNWTLLPKIARYNYGTEGLWDKNKR